MPERTFVFDAVSLGNFLLSESTGLLLRRYKARLRITPQVLDELVAGMRTRPALGEICNLVANRSVGRALRLLVRAAGPWSRMIARRATIVRRRN